MCILKGAHNRHAQDPLGPTSRCSVYLLYCHNRTNTDAEGAAGGVRESDNQAEEVMFVHAGIYI